MSIILQRISSYLSRGYLQEVNICVPVVMKLQEFDIMGFVQLIVYAFIGGNITVLGSPQVFDERIL